MKSKVYLFNRLWSISTWVWMPIANRTCTDLERLLGYWRTRPMRNSILNSTKRLWKLRMRYLITTPMIQTKLTSGRVANLWSQVPSGGGEEAGVCSLVPSLWLQVPSRGREGWVSALWSPVSGPRGGVADWVPTLPLPRTGLGYPLGLVPPPWSGKSWIHHWNITLCSSYEDSHRGDCQFQFNLCIT